MGRLILITNDDGIDAGGIRQLAETAKAFGEVWVVAPESQRSGKSHSVTYLEPLYVRERPGYMDGVKAYECSGVPVDCVRVGIHLLGRKPDVVLSGINSGYNISGDIQYSGTAGAALEAAPAVGFHIPGMFDKVLDIRRCWLQPEPSNAIRLEAKRFCLEHGYTFHNAREHSGLMRNLIVRTASTGEVMVIVVFGADDRSRITSLLDHLAEAFPQITSLFYVVNTKLNDSVGDLEAVCYRGKDHIIEQMEGLRFKVGPKSFYQTNSAQAYELYRVARDFADLQPDEVLYDLYTGTGTIANFCAARCRRVVGIEYVPEAIADAKINSELNGIRNTVFYAGDMKAVLDDAFVAANGHPDVVILDPPRAGVDEPVLDVLLRAAPQRIVYVSCNPATQARDLAVLDAAYRIEAVQPVDMFPHTHHVENVVKLVRR